MKIIISPKAEKQFLKLPKFEQIAITQKIRSFKENLKVSGEEKISGYKQIFRTRVGDYRIVYKKEMEQIYIILIAHRREVYQLLNQLFK